MAVLEAKNITKHYRKKTALTQFSCTFQPGITALLGPNGAGKSTLMNIMCTLLPASSGEILYDGKNILTLKQEYLGKISMLFQNQPMYKNYTSEEYLYFCGALKGLSPKTIAEQGDYYLKYFGIEDTRDRKISTFSGGMKQRLALCGAFLGNPEIILLDEPSAGLDIYERKELKRLLCNLKQQCIIILSTHIVSDVEDIADHIVLLKEGKIQFAGTPDKLEGTLDDLITEMR